VSEKFMFFSELLFDLFLVTIANDIRLLDSRSRYGIDKYLSLIEFFQNLFIGYFL
jgi:hypothetical protein